MFCENCGNAIELGANFCKTCGAEQETKATPLTTSEEVAPMNAVHAHETPPGVYSQSAGPSSGFSTGAVNFEPSVSVPHTVASRRRPARVTNFLFSLVNLLVIAVSPWFVFPGGFKVWGWNAIKLGHAHFGFPNGGYVLGAAAILVALSALVATVSKSKIGPALQLVFALGFLESVAGWFWVGRQNLGTFAGLWAMAALGLFALVMSLVQLFSKNN